MTRRLTTLKRSIDILILTFELSLIFIFLQTVVALDLYLAYLRAAFHTCYYCAVVTDHIEELQRKCVKHERKPLSKMLLEELKAAEAEKEKKEGEEGKEMSVDAGEDKSKVKENQNGKSKHDSRDWKRNGLLLSSCCPGLVLIFFRR